MIKYLYTWNMHEGNKGKPKRKIQIKNINPADLKLVKQATLVGGKRYDGSPEKSKVNIMLRASHAKQNNLSYYFYFEHYDKRKIITEINRVIFNLKNPDVNTKIKLNGKQIIQKNCEICDLDGSDKAIWSVEYKCLRWDDKRIDESICNVITIHANEIKKLRDEFMIYKKKV